jgi:hypothetical protein
MLNSLVIRLKRLRRNRIVVVVGFLAGAISTILTLAKPLYYRLENRPERPIAEGHGPIFQPPKLSARTIDGCLHTPLQDVLANGDPNGCNGPARMEIATEFCLAAGYKSAITFATENTGIFQHSYKLYSMTGSNGRLQHVWNKDDRGGHIFSMIECEGS